MSVTSAVASVSPHKDGIVSTAFQLGLFDLAIFLLTAIAIILALGGVVAFLNFRNIARKQAHETACEIAKEAAEAIANEHMQSELPKIMEEWLKLAQNSVSDVDAGKIAGAQEDGDQQ